MGSVVPSHVVESSETMESLPEPSDTVDDEWAAMKIRFKKEGLAWDKLGQDDRLLQVWRWMSDSETNLRTLRIKTEKHANLRNNEREELEEQIDKYAKKIFELENENKDHEVYKSMMTEKMNNLQMRNTEVEEDNRNLAYELKHALKEVEHMDCDQTNEEPNEEEVIEQKLFELENRIEDICLRHKETKLKYKEKLSLQKMDFEHRIEGLERQLGITKHELKTQAETLQAELEHGAELEKQLKNAYNERIEMAKKCLEKDDEVSTIR